MFCFCWKTILKLEVGRASRFVVCGNDEHLSWEKDSKFFFFHILSYDVFVVRYVSTSSAFSFRRRSVPS